MSVSRRTRLLAGGITSLPLADGVPSAQAEPRTSGAIRSSQAHLRPDLTSRVGATSPSPSSSSPPRAAYAAQVTTPDSRTMVGALVFRAAEDASAGYAAAVDSDRERVRLFDLADGRTIAAAPVPGARTGASYNPEVARLRPSPPYLMD